MTVDAAPHADLADLLERGYTLPATWYCDPAVYQLEQARIFERFWQYVGLAAQIPRPGDFFTCRLGRVPVIVLRDEQGKLRAFVNVCRHRGSELVLQEQGSRKSIQCHYHAWTYGLDGGLRAAPGMKDEPGFCPADFSLLPLPLDTWGPFVFVSANRDAPPLSHLLGELPALVAATGLDLGAIRLRRRDTYEIAANWKVVLDNYLECYHCPVAHPGFADLIDLNSYQIEEYEFFSTQGGKLKESARAGRGDVYTVTEGVEDGFYAYLWPNFTINIYPGPGNVSLNLFLPLDPERTLAIYEYCVVDQVTDDAVDEFVSFIDQVQREDIVLCEAVQRGLRSGAVEHGKLMLSRENALRHFQKLVYRFLSA